jgi:glycine cleavage system H protein
LADASYPEDLLYHDQHDWARLEGDDHAVFGITWYAQDSLGEVVFYDPPEVGAMVDKDSSYAEVESVRRSPTCRSDVRQIVQSTRPSPTPPSGSTRTPTAGWLVKVKLAAPAEAEALLGEEYRKLLEAARKPPPRFSLDGVTVTLSDARTGPRCLPRSASVERRALRADPEPLSSTPWRCRRG